MRQCTHVRTGIVTTHPDGGPIDKGHAARDCCARPACVEAAVWWVRRAVGMPGYYVADSELRSR